MGLLSRHPVYGGCVMSEQKSAEIATKTAQPDKQAPDNSEPSPERQAELRTAYEKNSVGGKPPYAGVVIRTRGEVNWIVRERGWRAGGFDTFDQAIDFRRVGVDGAVLSRLDLSFANLSDAIINDSTFSDTDFTGANLSGAFISDSTLSGAKFTNANLSGAFIADNISNEATLTNANLSGAIFGGDFTNADLRGI